MHIFLFDFLVAILDVWIFIDIWLYGTGFEIHYVARWNEKLSCVSKIWFIDQVCFFLQEQKVEPLDDWGEASSWWSWNSESCDSEAPEAKMAERKSKSLRWLLALQQSRFTSWDIEEAHQHCSKKTLYPRDVHKKIYWV